MFRRKLLLSLEQMFVPVQISLIAGTVCSVVDKNKNKKEFDGMFNYIFDAVKNSIENLMLNKPNMEDVRIKMAKNKKDKVEEPKQEEVKVEEPKQEEVKVEEPKQEEVKVDEIDMLLAYVQEYEIEKIMNESIEDLLEDEELAKNYIINEMYDDYDYADEIQYVDCSEEAKYLNKVFDINVNEEAEEHVEENKETVKWLENVMNSNGGNVEALFKKCEENKEELRK